MSLAFTFQEAEFNNLFPFYILIDDQTFVKSIGRTLEKICPNVGGKKFCEEFVIERPYIDDYSFDRLKSLKGQLIVIECNNKQKTSLRGQLDFREATNEFIFLGSPWFSSIEQLINTGLTLHDFAHHDPLTDLLHLMKTQEITNDDLKHLLNTVNKQKNELKEANKAIHDIALFPTQNPDPLIRINFNGDLLQNNPAASKLDFVEFEDKLYRNDFFFKIIAKRIDLNTSRTEFKGSYEGKYYSFICIPMREEGYINIYGRDITQQLIDREEVEKLSTIIQQTKNAVIITDAIGKIEWVNRAFTDITEYKLEEIKGKSPGSFLQGKDINLSTVEYMKEKIRNIEPFSCEVYNHKKSGKGYWLRINAQPVFNKAGKHVQYFAIEEDITLEKEAKARIEEFDKRLKVALEKIGDNVWEHDFTSGITNFSQEEAILFGYNAKEFTSNVHFWYSLVYSDDKKKLLENDALYLKGAIDHHTLEYRMVSKDGSINWILDRGVLIEKTADNKPLKIIGTHTNITSQKAIEKELEQRVQQIEESERRYRDVIDNSLAIITTHDMQGKFISVNPMVGKIFGYEDEEMIGHSLVEFLPIDDKDFFETNYLRKIKNEKSFTGTFRVVDKKGNIIYTLFNNFLKEVPGKEPFVIGFAVDITDRMKAEKELKIAKKITDELAKSKQNFLANMSHEIRTPLNGIMGMASQLQKTNLNKDQLSLLETIRSASDNLLVVINDILDLSKIEAGKLSLERIGFEPRTVVGRAMQVMRHKAEEKGLVFTNSFCDIKLAQVLIGDPYRLNQVLLNLISNAIKFTEKGSVDIACSVIEETETDQLVRAIVRDTGIGMDEAFVQKLFQKFSQEDDSVTRKYGGTGLGMSICKELVEMMGGKIYVESDKGLGTAVIFDISFQKGVLDDLPKIDEVNTDVRILVDKCILIADDNSMNRLVASAMLKSYGCKLVEAVDGIDALNKITEHNPDIVLMDVQMPQMDGLEATQIIRATISNELPVIALTALAIKGDEDKCKAAGMNDYLTKPFEESQLINMLSKWLGGRQIEVQTKTELVLTPLALFSLSKIEALANGDQNFVNEMIDIFIEQSTLSMKQMTAAFEIGDLSTIKKVAHRLKPSIDNMCIHSLKQEIRDLEIDAETLYSNNSLKHKLENFELILFRILADLKEQKI